MQKSEGERGLLCKMWGGRGDTSTLSAQERGFKKTSMSMCLYIQPDPFLHELSHMGCNDGFFDRFLIQVSRPKLFKNVIIRQYTDKLSGYPDDAITVSVEEVVRQHHDTSITYKLSPEAMQYFDDLCESHVDFVNRKYDEGKFTYPCKSLYQISVANKRFNTLATK